MNTNYTADALDRLILDAIQNDIPLEQNPWAVIAGRLAIPETVLLERLERLRQAGILRGISPILESRSLGLTAATLVALPVAEERIREVADLISQYPEVSHNFRRNHHYSLWFTLSAKDEGRLAEVLQEILARTGFGIHEVLNLPTVRKIKIDVRFPLVEGTKRGSHGSP